MLNRRIQKTRKLRSRLASEARKSNRDAILNSRQRLSVSYKRSTSINMSIEYECSIKSYQSKLCDTMRAFVCAR